MKKEPFIQQINGNNYLVNRGGSGYLYMDMRTGKTFTAILGLTSKVHPFPCLVLAPLTPLADWESELLDFGFAPEDIVIVTGNWQQRRNLLRSEGKIFLLNYDVAPQLDVLNVRKNDWSILDWNTIIFDESYCIAINKPDKVYRESDKEKYGNYPHKISKRVRYFLPEVTGPIPPYQTRIALSGLPAPESPLNLCTQFLIIDGHFLGYTSLVEYLKDNWSYDKYTFSWQPNHPYHKVRIQEYLDANAFCVTMEQANIGYNGLLKSCWSIEPTREQILLLDWLESATTYNYPDDEPGTINTMTGGVKFSFGLQICAGVHPLTKEIIPCNKGKYLMEWFKLKKEQCVVASKSKKALRPLAEYLGKHGIKTVVVDGDSKLEDRKEAKRLFETGEVDMLLGQSKVIMMGYNLAVADWLFHFSNTPEENVRGQVNMRCCKGDKIKPVTVVDLAIKGTKERDLVDIMNNKDIDAKYWISQQNNFYTKD